MEIRDRAIGSVAIIALDGRLTVNERPGQLKEAVQAALGRGSVHVVLDLTGIRYMDSTRLGELIAAHITVSRVGGRLTLAATPPRVVELLTLAGLDGIFERFETVDEAAATVQMS